MNAILIGVIASLVPWGLLAVVIAFVVTNPEKMERIAGWLLRFLSWGSGRIRRRSITLSLQGRMNTFARSLDSEAQGVMPFNVQMQFVTRVDRAEFDPDKQVVIVRIRDRIDDDLNLVHGMLVYSQIGVIPQARPYLNADFSGAIDMTMTRKLLNSLKHHSALGYLQDMVFPSVARKTPGLESCCRTLDILDERGYFTRILLPELRDFGAAIETRFPESHHAEEAGEFLEYVEQLATKPPGEQSSQLGHRGRYIATAFLPVGSVEKMSQGGQEPYLSHLRLLRGWGFRKVYVVARGDPQDRKTWSMEMAETVARSAERLGLATPAPAMRFHGIAQDGTNRSNIIIEMGLIPDSQASRGRIPGGQAGRPPLRAPPDPIRRRRR